MGHPDFPPHLTDKQPAAKVLETLEFFPNSTGGVERRWGDLTFSACEAFDCWFVIRGPFRTARELWPPYEVRIPSKVAPVEVMATIYRLWAEVYRGVEPPDAYLLWGKEWLDYQREVKALVPPRPALWAEREFLRHCLTYIERLHDWIEADYEIRLAQVPGQLRIQAKDAEVFCPARGTWPGEVVVSAKDLFRRLPKRFTGSAVVLQIEGDKLIVESRLIPAKWNDDSAVSQPGNQLADP